MDILCKARQLNLCFFKGRKRHSSRRDGTDTKSRIK